MTLIPVYSAVSARYYLEIVLAGEVFTLRFDWNTRDESWAMDIVANSGADILTGIKLVPNYVLTKQYSMIPGMPAGDFYLLDDSNVSTNGLVTFENFGDRYKLYFATADEIAAEGWQ